MKKLLSSIVCASFLMGCMDDLDVDKISGTVTMNTTLLVPLATADVSVEYMFDQANNAVEYFVAEDGTKRVRLRADHDSIASYSLMDVIRMYQNQELLDVNVSDLLSYTFDEQSGPQEVKLNWHVNLSPMSGVTIKSMECGYTVEVGYSGFSCPAKVALDVAGETSVCDLDANSGIASDKKESVKVDVTDGGFNVSMVVSSTEIKKGHWGQVRVKLVMDSIDKVTCSTSGVTFETMTYITLPHMENFSRFGHNISFKDPKIWLTSTNTSQMNMSMTPKVSSHGEELLVLKSGTYNIKAGEVGASSLLNKSNSNIEEMFTNLPDSLGYLAEVALTMQSGKSEIVINKEDSLYLGYHYEVPFVFKINTEVDCDTMKISDMPSLDKVVRAKLLSTTVNSLPVGATFSMQLANIEEGRALSKLNVDELVGVPNINSNGVSTNEVEMVKNIELTEQNMADLKQADALIIKVYVSTHDIYVAPKIEDKLKLDLSFVGEFELGND